jgi:arsenate reductase-like glutaredoxin family protein
MMSIGIEREVVRLVLLIVPSRGAYKEKAAAMTPKDVVVALAGDPILIKRPIIVSEKGIAVGFEEATLRRILSTG